jgi:hypothetical protein
MNAEAALEFWLKIDAYADAWGEVQVEGNSGEFSDNDEIERVNTEFQAAQDAMIASFKDVIGYMPVYTEVMWPGKSYWSLG